MVARRIILSLQSFLVGTNTPTILVADEHMILAEISAVSMVLNSFAIEQMYYILLDLSRTLAVSSTPLVPRPVLVKT
jgi:hypothetical protein